MPVGAEEERESWYAYFDPCGIKPVNGFILQTCISLDCERIHCMSKGSFAMAGYLLEDDTSVEQEKREFEQHVRQSMIGKEVVDIDGNTVRVSEEDIPNIVDDVVSKALAITKEIDMCVHMSTPMTIEYLQNCSNEQRGVLNILMEKAELLDRFQGNTYQATLHEEETQQIIETALELGLGELGLVARCAIRFGLGDTLPQCSMNHIFQHPGPGQLNKRP